MNFNTNFASVLRIWDFHNRLYFIMKLWWCRHPTPTLYRAGCDAKPTHTFWPKKLLRKHDMVMKIQVLILGSPEKGSLGRPRVDPGQNQGITRAHPKQNQVDPGQIWQTQALGDEMEFFKDIRKSRCIIEIKVIFYQILVVFEYSCWSHANMLQKWFKWTQIPKTKVNFGVNSYQIMKFLVFCFP